MGAGVHAAGTIEHQLPYPLRQVLVRKPFLDRPGEREGADVGQAAIVGPWAGEEIGQEPHIGGRQPRRIRLAPQGVQVGPTHLGQHQVLAQRDPHLTETVVIRPLGDLKHLDRGQVPGGLVGAFGGERDDGVAGAPVGLHIVSQPGAIGGVALEPLPMQGVVTGMIQIGAIGKVGCHLGDLVLAQCERAIRQSGPFSGDPTTELVDPQCPDQEFKARPAGIIPAASAIEDPTDRLAVAQQVLPGEEFLQLHGQHREAAEPAAHDDPKARFPVGIAHQCEPDVVALDECPIIPGTLDRDLELAREVGESGVSGTPLTQQFAPGPGVEGLVRGDPGQRVRGDIADAVAGGLDGVQLHPRQVGEEARGVLQRQPVDLEVVPGGEVPVAPAIGGGGLGQGTQLSAGDQTIGDGDAQHGTVTLDIQAILQAQGAQVIGAQLTGQVTLELVAQLGHPPLDQLLVVCVVLVHGFGVRGLGFGVRGSGVSVPSCSSNPEP